MMLGAVLCDIEEPAHDDLLLDLSRSDDRHRVGRVTAAQIQVVCSTLHLHSNEADALVEENTARPPGVEVAVAVDDPAAGGVVVHGGNLERVRSCTPVLLAVSSELVKVIGCRWEHVGHVVRVYVRNELCAALVVPRHSIRVSHASSAASDVCTGIILHENVVAGEVLRCVIPHSNTRCQARKESLRRSVAHGIARHPHGVRGVRRNGVRVVLHAKGCKRVLDPQVKQPELLGRADEGLTEHELLLDLLAAAGGVKEVDHLCEGVADQAGAGGVLLAKVARGNCEERARFRASLQEGMVAHRRGRGKCSVNHVGESNAEEGGELSGVAAAHCDDGGVRGDVPELHSLLDDDDVVLQRLFNGEAHNVLRSVGILRSKRQRIAVETVLREEHERANLHAELEHESVMVVASVNVGLSTWAEEDGLDLVIGRVVPILVIDEIALLKGARVARVEVVKRLSVPVYVWVWRRKPARRV
mmetsp:Transcript_14566/g.57196  ORF Transcript_14566/g.57196 Transcript_14566/m.57196 type:complete len:473 (-) Transcript_14566:105-1523(-)